MKIIQYIALSTSLLLAGCSDFLLEEPTGSLSKSEVYENISTAEMAVMGVYRSVSEPWAGLYVTIGNSSNDIAVPTWSGESSYFGNYTNSYTPTSSDVYDLWRLSFNAIVDANDCINNITPMVVKKGDAEAKSELIAECKFLRAFVYFDMIQLFGAVPLYLDSDSAYNEGMYVGRTPVSKVMQQILLDATAAYNGLPDPKGVDMGGRASKYAAAMLLAKVYMLRAGYFVDGETGVADPYFDNGRNSEQRTTDLEMAAYYLHKCVESKNYSLASCNTAANDIKEYGKIFLNSSRAQVASEVIFDIQFLGPDRPSKWGTRGINGGNHYYADLGYYYQWGGAMPVSEFALSYADDDIRFKWNIGTYTLKNGDSSTRAIVNGAQWKQAKHRLESNNCSQNAMVYRYADALLMLSEVTNELASAIDIAHTIDANGESVTLRPATYGINLVRERVAQVAIDQAYLDAENPALLANPSLASMDKFGWLYGPNLDVDYPTSGIYTNRHVYYNNSAVPTSSKERFRNALQMERAWELCFERHRWFDLKRWGIQYDRASKVWSGCHLMTLGSAEDPCDKSDLYVRVTGVAIPFDGRTMSLGSSPALSELQKYHRYLPIPYTEMLVNKELTQNIGYY